MRVSDLKRAIANLPDDATINAINYSDHPDEFGIGRCVSYNPKLKVLLLANDALAVSTVEQVLWDEAES